MKLATLTRVPREPGHVVFRCHVVLGPKPTVDIQEIHLMDGRREPRRLTLDDVVDVIAKEISCD